MGDSSVNLNGCYILNFDGEKIPIKRGLASALRRILIEQKIANGQITIHFKNGGVSAVETKTMLALDDA